MKIIVAQNPGGQWSTINKSLFLLCDPTVVKMVEDGNSIEQIKKFSYQSHPGFTFNFSFVQNASQLKVIDVPTGKRFYVDFLGFYEEVVYEADWITAT